PKITAAGQRAGLEAGRELVSLSHLDACSVIARHRIERAVEVTPAQRNDGLELVPGPADVLQPVGHTDELHRDLLPPDFGELAHAPRCVYQPPPTGAAGARSVGRASSALPTTFPATAPSWKTTVFSPLSRTSSK